MQISLKALKKFLRLDLEAKVIAQKLDMLGIEVESIEEMAPAFRGVVVARVEKTAPHPNAERLLIADVFDGKEHFSVVCGASNCRPGLFAFAPIGAEVVKGDEPLKISKVELRGEPSFGMLLSEDELGLVTQRAPGLWELNPGESLGDPIAPYFTDTIFHIGLTPNLSHCQSVYGIARELAALLNLELTPLPEPLEVEAKALPVTIKEGALSYSLTQMTIEPVPSPLCLRGHLHTHGVRAISLPVDCTNYIMTTYGLPTHAFAGEGLEEITIGPIEKEQPFKTLDEKEPQLEAGDIAIFSGKSPIALAGIMGGSASEVKLDSTEIAFEAAVFNSAPVRRTCRRLGLRTEASSRFERGSDPEMPARAARVFIDELNQAGAQCKNLRFTSVSNAPPKQIISLRPPRVKSLLGIDISEGEISSILESLGFKISAEKEALSVEVPSWRVDVSLEIDLIEEIARLWGYDNFPAVSSMASLSSRDDDLRWRIQKELRSAMIRLGAQEMMTCSLISEEMLEPWKNSIDMSLVMRVKNASVVQYSWLRPSLLPGLVQAISYNGAHGKRNLFAFEVGTVHLEAEESESHMLSFAMTGESTPEHFSRPSKPLDFFDLKAVVEELLSSFPLPPVAIEHSDNPSLHPHAQASLSIDSCILGHIGRCHPLIEKSEDLPPLFIAEICIDDLMAHLRTEAFYKPVSLFPSTKRDWTLSVSKEMPYALLEKACLSAGGALLKDIELVSIYEGDHLKPGYHNLSVRLTYQKNDATLLHDEAESAHSALQAAALSSLADYLA